MVEKACQSLEHSQVPFALVITATTLIPNALRELPANSIVWFSDEGSVSLYSTSLPLNAKIASKAELKTIPGIRDQLATQIQSTKGESGRQLERSDQNNSTHTKQG
ncbi:hypothetical protein EON65_49560 [archaeon]|nr:MAG: hypothetical protein EON65_49560 [archaeon]